MKREISLSVTAVNSFRDEGYKQQSIQTQLSVSKKENPGEKISRVVYITSPEQKGS
jgi:hypothetical protein